MKFTNHVHRDLHLNAQYELNPGRNLYYVYVMSTPDLQVAISEALRLRSQSELRDAWVFHGLLGKQQNVQEAASGTDIHPATETTITEVPAEDPPVTEQPASAKAPAEEEEPDNGVEGKRFLFTIYKATNNDTIQGIVDMIDPERARKLGSFKGNKIVKVPKPSGKSTNITLLCQVFGYRKLQREIDYNNPEGEDITKEEDGSVEIPFEMVRLRKGDIAVMYNVFFFKDAAVMRPESRYEINNLLAMMNENPNCKIRVHGHTNGSATGKVISINKGSNNFFSLTDTHDGFGSAKKLSEERASLIKEYLVTSGVAADRIQVKAWGGKRPLHDKNSNRAQENVRVEVEILED
jgi:outer membrane protein OmpA-like peptidoglycan-associated protein